MVRLKKVDDGWRRHMEAACIDDTVCSILCEASRLATVPETCCAIPR